MTRRLEHLGAGLVLCLSLLGVYSDKLLGPGYIFTELIQDITNIYGFYPWDLFSAKEIRSGYFPLWNPHNGLGIPHLANMQSAVFYPLTWLKFFLDFWLVIDWLLIIRLWLAGFFLYLLLRTAFGLEAIYGIFGGLSYALCGYFMRYVYMSHLNVECLLPLQVYLFYQLGQKPGRRYFLLSILGIYLLITGGFPEATLYALIFSGLYFLFIPGTSLNWFGKFILLSAVIISGFLLSSAQWLPFYEYLVQAWTYHQKGVGLKHLDLFYSISLLLPWFFGKNSESTLVPFLAPGMGTLSVIFSLRAFWAKNSKSAQVGFWLSSSIFLLGLIYGIPPMIWLGKIFPFNLTYNYKYALPVLSLCLSVLGGIGMKEFLQGTRLRRDWVVLSLAWFWAMVNLIIGLLDGFKPFYGYGAHLEVARLFFLMIVLILVLALRNKKSIKPLAGVLLFISMFGSIYFDYQMNRGEELFDYLNTQMWEAKKLKGIFSEPYRYSAEGDILFPNILLPLEVDDLRSYDPLYPKSYVYLMASVNGLSGENEINQHYNEHKLFQLDREHLNSALVPVLNLKLYSADYELNSRPIARELIRNGSETGDFVGWVREEVGTIGGITKKYLLTHSNGKLTGEVLNRPMANELYFETGMASKENNLNNDGGQFMVLVSEDNKSRLVYSRFFHPVLREEERVWKQVRVKLLSAPEHLGISLISLSGPRGNNLGDYFAWAGLRLYSDRYSGPVYENWTEQGEVSLNYLPEGYPRYFLVQSIGVIGAKNLKEELLVFQRLASAQKGFFRNQAVLNSEMKFERSEKNLGGISWVKVIKNEPERIELELRSPVDCFLLASDQYFPGWRARIDDQETRIHRADMALRCLFIPAGGHKIVFWYEPVGFRIGLFVSLGAIFSIFLILIIPRTRFK